MTMTLADWRCGRALCLAVLALVLAGCASAPMIRSDVTAFHEWPATLTDKSFVFERTKQQNDSLEYRNYEELVRAELQRVGLTPAGVGARDPALRVNMNYAIEARDVRVVEPVVMQPGWGPSGFGPYWPRYGMYDPFFPHPFWNPPVIVRYDDASYTVYTRRLHITIARAGKGGAEKLYDVTVISEGRNPSLAAVMPYMIKSAFAEFPGKSGVPRRVELPFQQ